MQAVIMILLFFVIGCIIGAFMAWMYVGQEELSKRENLEVTISVLRARELPPRVLEIWKHTEPGQRLVMLGSIDADIAIEALALVGAGVRTFSEDGLNGILTRREVQRLRRELIERAYCTWHPSGRSQGIVWTDEGIELLKTCQNEGVRTHTHAPRLRRGPIRLGVGGGDGCLVTTP